MNDFSLLITHWFRQNYRDLPWRNTNNPYFIWLSEIILQQTRVNQGMQYYLKFTKNYPTIFDLAKSDEQNILNDWQGLGYYSRARNLHYSAQYIVNELNGVFPQTYNEIIKLKGVGKYTAAAIASFAFNESKAVVDGNVYRLLSRVFDIPTPIDSGQGQKEFQSLADELIDPNNPAEHNQSIMEVGSSICSPSPNCEICPLTLKCLSYTRQTIHERPVKSKKTKVTDKYFHFFIYENNGKTYIEKRTKKGIWQNLFQFPLIETKENELPKELNKHQTFRTSKVIKHILSHQRIYAQFHHITSPPIKIQKEWIEINHENIQDYPLPRIIDRYLEEFDIS
ncbi:MAG: A/G-specific adenine glycosylase [Crocinitomicaceae bacterium]|nr:A/G-specific adenine glycosylase [Crocinitomicaceae bacterium]